jgi:hypothetical protein
MVFVDKEKKRQYLGLLIWSRWLRLMPNETGIVKLSISMPFETIPSSGLGNHHQYRVLIPFPQLLNEPRPKLRTPGIIEFPERTLWGEMFHRAIFLSQSTMNLLRSIDRSDIWLIILCCVWWLWKMGNRFGNESGVIKISGVVRANHISGGWPWPWGFAECDFAN